MVFECDECDAQYVNVKTPKEVDALQARVKELEDELKVQKSINNHPNRVIERSYNLSLAALSLEKENARLRKVVEAAREAMKYTDGTFAPNFPEPIAKLKNAIRELDTSTCVA